MARKMSILKKTLLILPLLIVAFLILVALQPAEYRVVRTAALSAPPAVVFDHVNNFHNWEAWSPWIKLDPAAKNAFDGPASGTGAGFSWAGNDKVGQGRMIITQSHPNDLIAIQLEFIKPFASTANTVFIFKPEPTGTTVTWAMSGHKNFVSKAVCMFMNMDKMVGGDFERGLANLKSVAEARK
jgi:hypothetical protein